MPAGESVHHSRAASIVWFPHLNSWVPLAWYVGIGELGGQQMRDRDAIDGELRLIAALRRAATRNGGQISDTERIDDLLDERLASVGADRPES